VVERGGSAGRPVLSFHGAIGSSLGPSPEVDAVLAELDIRYLLLDRPGFGRSDPRSGRTLLDWARDVEELADRLGLGAFDVVGVSAGGPYALACATSSGRGSGGVAVVSGLGPVRPPHRGGAGPRCARLGAGALLRRPAVAAALGDAAVRAVRRRPELLRWGIDAADRVLAMERFLAAAAGGVRPMVDDYLVTTRPWGFAPEGVRAMAHLWHGMRDPLVPVDDALALAVALPACRVWLDPDEGHFFFRRRLREILGALTGRELDAT
jgi:pimeloyl-ACP methyl ester carboxylesterase